MVAVLESSAQPTLDLDAEQSLRDDELRMIFMCCHPKLAPDAQVVEAHWKPVKLPYRETGINAAGQCELLEQFIQKIMPLFTTRNVDLRATCVPHQLEPLGTKLQAEVLITDQKKDVAKQASAADAR